MGAVLGHKVPVGSVRVVEFLQLVLHPDEGRLELVHADVKLVGSVDVNHQHVNPAAKLQVWPIEQFFKHPIAHHFKEAMLYSPSFLHFQRISGLGLIQ